MGLKLVVVVRHGEDQKNSLTQRGEEQVSKLAEAIKTRINGFSKIAILTSPVRRATQTSKIIGQKIGVNPTECKELWWDKSEDGKMQMEAICEAAGNSDVVVAITHFEAHIGIVSAFHEKFFGEELWCRRVREGQGIALSLSRPGAVDYLPRPREL
ncbi:MAG: phosphoglycerate mutase family protein [Candidatus Kaiserbacteria bacterium]|nr:phosphoglycerate mutase family protein [Candidatus Kaiserbacteria bacterium]